MIRKRGVGFLLSSRFEHFADFPPRHSLMMRKKTKTGTFLPLPFSLLLLLLSSSHNTVMAALSMCWTWCDFHALLVKFLDDCFSCLDSWDFMFSVHWKAKKRFFGTCDECRIFFWGAKRVNWSYHQQLNSVITTSRAPWNCHYNRRVLAFYETSFWTRNITDVIKYYAWGCYLNMTQVTIFERDKYGK